MPDPDTHHDVYTAQQQLEAAVLHAIQRRHYSSESDPHADASFEHADEGVALAARDLTAAVQALDAGQRPIGWDAHSFGPFSTEQATHR